MLTIKATRTIWNLWQHLDWPLGHETWKQPSSTKDLNYKKQSSTFFNPELNVEPKPKQKSLRVFSINLHQLELKHSLLRATAALSSTSAGFHPLKNTNVGIWNKNCHSSKFTSNNQILE